MADSMGRWHQGLSAAHPMGSKLKPNNDSFVDRWTSSSALWGARHGVGEALDRFMGLHEPFTSIDSQQLKNAGFDYFENIEESKQGSLSYSHILKLDGEAVKWKELSWKRLQAQITDNTNELRNGLKPNNIRHFFDDVSFKDYAKQTLWEGNVRPIKELLDGSYKNFFKNLFYTAGVGFIGFTLVKTGMKSYRYWKAQENSSISGQWKTAYETVKAVGKKAIQSLASWEAAGIGMAIGQALLPVGSIPIGGIVIGALFATTVYKAVGKLFSSRENMARRGLSKS